MHINKLRKNME